MQSYFIRVWRKVALFGLLPVSYFFLTSCEDPKDIGLNLTGGGGQVVTTFTDTVSVDVSTMLLDSAITSGRTEVLVGSYNDPIFGAVEARNFFQINLTASSAYSGYYNNYDIKAGFTDQTIDPAYDSVGVYLGYNRFNYGKDTLQDLTLTLYPLLEKVNPSPVNYTSSNSVHYDETNPLATKRVMIRDLINVKGDSAHYINFKLPDDFGKKLFALSGQMATEINYTDNTGVTTKVNVGDNDKFHDFLQGFALVAKRGPNVVYSFNLASPPSGGSYLYLAYHKVKNGNPLNTADTELTDTTALKTDIARYVQQFVFSGGRFTQIKVNRQGTPLAKITQPLVPVPASQTGGKTYLHNGTGITTKIRINPTSLQNLLKLGKITVNKAELVFKTPTDSLNNIQPPGVLGLLDIDKANRFITTRLTSGSYRYSYVPDDANGLAVHSYDATNKQYKYNITTYIQDLLSGKRTYTEQALSVVSQVSDNLGSFWAPRNTTLSRAVFDKGAIKLNIYYSATK